MYRIYSAQEEKKNTRPKISFLPRAPLIHFSRLSNNPLEGRGSHSGHRNGGRFIPFRRLFPPAGALAPALTRPAPSGRDGRQAPEEMAPIITVKSYSSTKTQPGRTKKSRRIDARCGRQALCYNLGPINFIQSSHPRCLGNPSTWSCLSVLIRFEAHNLWI